MTTAESERKAVWLKKSREENPGKWKRRDRKRVLRKYGLTIETYKAMEEAQYHRCGICGDYESKTNQGGFLPLAVDHDHYTGEVRGLLCNRCNRVLGMVREDQDVLREMIKYLKETE